MANVNQEFIRAMQKKYSYLTKPKSVPIGPGVNNLPANPTGGPIGNQPVFTGRGPRDQIAGTVHKNEMVIPEGMVKAAGGPDKLMGALTESASQPDLKTAPGFQRGMNLGSLPKYAVGTSYTDYTGLSVSGDMFEKEGPNRGMYNGMYSDRYDFDAVANKLYAKGTMPTNTPTETTKPTVPTVTVKPTTTTNVSTVYNDSGTPVSTGTGTSLRDAEANIQPVTTAAPKITAPTTVQTPEQIRRAALTADQREQEDLAAAENGHKVGDPDSRTQLESRNDNIKTAEDAADFVRTNGLSKVTPPVKPDLSTDEIKINKPDLRDPTTSKVEDFAPGGLKIAADSDRQDKFENLQDQQIAEIQNIAKGGSTAQKLAADLARQKLAGSLASQGKLDRQTAEQMGLKGGALAAAMARGSRDASLAKFGLEGQLAIDAANRAEDAIMQLNNIAEKGQAFEEAKKQFGANFDLQKANFGLDVDKYNEAKQQFSEGLQLDWEKLGLDVQQANVQRDQFKQQMDLAWDKFGKDVEQFGVTSALQALQVNAQINQTKADALLLSGNYDAAAAVWKTMGVDVDFSNLKTAESQKIFGNSMANFDTDLDSLPEGSKFIELDTETNKLILNEGTKDSAAYSSLVRAWNALHPDKAVDVNTADKNQDFMKWANNTYDSRKAMKSPYYAMTSAYTDSDLYGMLNGAKDPSGKPYFNADGSPNEAAEEFKFGGLTGKDAIKGAMTNLWMTGGLKVNEEGHIDANFEHPAWKLFGMEKKTGNMVQAIDPVTKQPLLNDDGSPKMVEGPGGPVTTGMAKTKSGIEFRTTDDSGKALSTADLATKTANAEYVDSFGNTNPETLEPFKDAKEKQNFIEQKWKDYAPVKEPIFDDHAKETSAEFKRLSDTKDPKFQTLMSQAQGNPGRAHDILRAQLYPNFTKEIAQYKTDKAKYDLDVVTKVTPEKVTAYNTFIENNNLQGKIKNNGVRDVLLGTKNLNSLLASDLLALEKNPDEISALQTKGLLLNETDAKTPDLRRNEDFFKYLDDSKLKYSVKDGQKVMTMKELQDSGKGSYLYGKPYVRDNQGDLKVLVDKDNKLLVDGRLNFEPNQAIKFGDKVYVLTQVYRDSENRRTKLLGKDSSGQEVIIYSW